MSGGVDVSGPIAVLLVGITGSGKTVLTGAPDAVLRP